MGRRVPACCAALRAGVYTVSARFLAQFATTSWQITTSGGGVLTLPDDDYFLLDSVIVDPSILKALNTLTGFTWQMATSGRVTVNTGPLPLPGATRGCAMP